MSYAKGRSWALLLSIYKWRRRSCGDSWSRQRAPLKQKAAINRISLILPSRKEEHEILFPFRRDQEIGSSHKKNAWYK